MKMLKKFLLPLAMMMAPTAILAQEANPTAPAAAASAADIAATADAKTADKAAAPKSTDGSLPGYTPMAPTKGVGMPIPGQMDFQEQFTENGQYAKNI